MTLDLPEFILLSGMYYPLANYVFYCPIFSNCLIAFTSYKLHKYELFACIYSVEENHYW